MEAGEEKPWIEAFISIPVTVVVDMKEDEAAMFLSSLKMSESLVKAGQLSRKTPLIRIAEVARAAKMLPSPVTHQKIADWFSQARFGTFLPTPILLTNMIGSAPKLKPSIVDMVVGLRRNPIAYSGTAF